MVYVLPRTAGVTTNGVTLLRELYSKASLIESEMNLDKCEHDKLLVGTEGSAARIKTSSSLTDPMKCKELHEVVVEAAVWGGGGSVQVRRVGKWSWASGLVLTSGQLQFTPPRNLAGRPLILTTVHVS